MFAQARTLGQRYINRSCIRILSTISLFVLYSLVCYGQTPGASGSTTSVITMPLTFQNFELNLSGTQCLQVVPSGTSGIGSVVGTTFPCPVIQLNGTTLFNDGVNFVASSVNAVGLTATATNPGVDNLAFEIAGVYNGNAATATALAAAPTQCTGGQVSIGVAANGNANCIVDPGSSGAGSIWTYNPTSLSAYSAGTFYSPVNGNFGAGPTTTQSRVQIPMFRAGTIQGLSVLISAPQGTGASLAITIMDGTTASAVTCTIAAGASACSDLTHTLSFAAGDLLSVQQIQVGTGPQAVISYSIGYK